MKVCVSACLLGVRCRYDGAEKRNETICSLAKSHLLIPFCPEIYGGLPTPREPAELRNGRVYTRSGQDVTSAYQRGAEEMLRIIRQLGCEGAILMDRSPSCGYGMIHDGTFSGGLIEGNGMTAALLRAEGIPVYAASSITRSDVFGR